MTENSTASGSTAGSTQQVSLPTFTSNVPPPGRLELKGKLSDNWKKWKQVWDAYETVTKLNEKESKFRVATFITLAPKRSKYTMVCRFAPRMRNRT